jgi:FkbM family methyltransferase
MNTYSQFSQDIYVFREIYKEKKNGFFVEVGAHDGIKFSNTLFLENNGWKGVCIEPHPAIYQLLLKNRPKCICIDYAAYKDDDKLLPFIMSDISCGCSGFEYSNLHEFIKNKKRCVVKTKKLTTILDEIKAPSFIEYISLDTEGSELDILNGLDFNKYKIGYFSIEHNHHQRNRESIRSFMISKGYSFHRENHVDDDYILKDIN